MGRVIYSLSKNHYSYQKTFRIVQPNNDIDEYTINKKLLDDKSKELMSIENEISIGNFDIRVIGNSTMPSNKWAEWNIYMEAYQAGLIDKVEALKKTDIFDNQGVLQRTDIIAKLQQQLKQAGEQIKSLKGDLQTAQRESVHDKKRVEIAKFQGKLKESELESKKGSELAVGKLTSAVKLEQEKLRLRGQAQEKQQKSQNKGE